MASLLTTSTLVDEAIWHRGASASSPNERTFLRGIHHPISLKALLGLMAGACPGKAVRLTSAWVDRHPQAHAVLGKFNCEVGDLLVVWRERDGALNVVREVGWLLQAKMAAVPTVMSHHDPSSVNEYALYETPSDWSFALHHFKQRLGKFDLRFDADINTAAHAVPLARHWNYLQICYPRHRASAAWASPLQMLWDSTTVHKQAGFCDALLGMIPATPLNGVVLDGTNPEFARLCHALLAFTWPRNSRLARGPWQHNVMALVPADAGPARSMASAYLAMTAPEAWQVRRARPIQNEEGVSWLSSGSVPPDGDGLWTDRLDGEDGIGFGALVIDSIDLEPPRLG